MKQLFQTVSSWLKSLDNRLRPSSWISVPSVKLIVVRRYADANGNYVGELYLLDPDLMRMASREIYTMIGASLDSFPLECTGKRIWSIDTKNDFLAYLPKRTLRVGAVDPLDNIYVQRRMARLPCWNMHIVIQNRLIKDMEKRAIQ
jgi:hypothetical protein